MTDLPDSDKEIVGGVSSDKTGKDVSRMKGLDDDGVWKDDGSALLLHRDYLVKTDDEVGDPAKDIAGEANVAFGNIESAMKKYVPLQGGTVIFNQVVIFGDTSKGLMKVLVPFTARNGETGQTVSRSGGTGINQSNRTSCCSGVQCTIGTTPSPSPTITKLALDTTGTLQSIEGGRWSWWRLNASF